MADSAGAVNKVLRRVKDLEEEVRKLKLRNYGEGFGGDPHAPRSFFANAPKGAPGSVVGDNGGTPTYMRYSNILHETNPGDYDEANGIFLPGGISTPAAGEWGFAGVVSGISQGFSDPLIAGVDSYQNTLLMYVWDFGSSSLVDTQPLDVAWVEGFASVGHGLKDKITLAFAGTWAFNGAPVGLLFSIGVPSDSFGFVHPTRGSLAGWEIA